MPLIAKKLDDPNSSMVVFVADKLAREREAAGVAPAAQTYASLWRNACKLFGL